MKYKNIEYTMNDQVAKIQFKDGSMNASLPYGGSKEACVQEIEKIIDEVLEEIEDKVNL